MDDARRIFTSLYGSDKGFEAQFSPGTDLETMSATEFMQRLQVSEPFHVTEHLQEPSVYNRRLIDTFNRMEEQCLINTVDNGEFELCAKEVRKCLEMEDDISPNRPPALVLERCRRGGKTFMLCAVAKMLAESLEKKHPPVYVVQISLNTKTPYRCSETADSAIYSRIAYFIANQTEDFHEFRKVYSNFNSVRSWLLNTDVRVILLIDELNVIPSRAPNYDEMSFRLDCLVGKRGGALLYSTHHRINDILLRGRRLESDSKLSLRTHKWMTIPLIESEKSLILKPSFTFGFWSAVLRGRIPALICLASFDTKWYAPDEDNNIFTDRQNAMGAVLTGDPSGLQAGRDHFRSYCYRGDNKDLLWPPFLIAQSPVLGKEASHLRNTLESPDTNPAKAFEALVALSVLVRLLSRSENNHKFVPRHRLVSDTNSFEATEIIHAHERNQDIPSLIRAVKEAFPRTTRGRVLQLVAIPLYEHFPKYDFFLLHRGQLRGWSIEVGYQCKMGQQYLDRAHRAESRRVVKSLWVEGKGPETCINKARSHG
ncbi:hypothetical protein IV203_028538 [Nitzschia inconspicua]|uniref:Uncharacterized protein n=1 Tax=Nitzschia inconspicua TaxID=303405 RepID=A0A9K3LQ22_9STRA|nr:hypothetical protein IV203_028538 [Nitzschia inconspicua]